MFQCFIIYGGRLPVSDPSVARPYPEEGSGYVRLRQYWKEATVLSCEGVAACTRLKSQLDSERNKTINRSDIGGLLKQCLRL